MFAVGGVAALAIAVGVSQKSVDAQARPAAIPDATPPSTPPEAARITGTELKALVAKGQAVLIDVRSAEAFAASHAEGAIHVPLAGLEAKRKDLPKQKLIAAYCT